MSVYFSPEGEYSELPSNERKPGVVAVRKGVYAKEGEGEELEY